jgi:hypothetical protein
LGGNWFKHLIWFLILVFLAWSYQHDTQACEDMMIRVRDDPMEFCLNITRSTLEENVDFQQLRFQESETQNITVSKK